MCKHYCGPICPVAQVACSLSTKVKDKAESGTELRAISDVCRFFTSRAER